MGGAIKYFPKIYWAMKNLGLWPLRLRFKKKKVENSPDPTPIYLMHAPLAYNSLKQLIALYNSLILKISQNVS